MSPDAKVSIEPLLLAGQAGQLFAVYFKPSTATDVGTDFVYIPPFAEEMNRSRRTAALQARSLAARGIGALILDLYGTGDSAGDFVDARWPIWQSDVRVAADWLERQGRRTLGLWGLRLGAILATQIAAAQPGRFSRLLLWQPVVDGPTMLSQFLRIRVAAAMAAKEKESVSALRNTLASGDPVEVAGYVLAPELAAALDSLRLENGDVPVGSAIDWIEIRDDENAVAMPASRERILADWRNKGAPVSIKSVVAQSFWSIEESPPAIKVVAATQDILTGDAP